jgi:hypothetical protein
MVCAPRKLCSVDYQAMFTAGSKWKMKLERVTLTRTGLEQATTVLWGCQLAGAFSCSFEVLRR